MWWILFVLKLKVWNVKWLMIIESLGWHIYALSRGCPFPMQKYTFLKSRLNALSNDVWHNNIMWRSCQLHSQRAMANICSVYIIYHISKHVNIACPLVQNNMIRVDICCEVSGASWFIIISSWSLLLIFKTVC